MVMRGEGKDWRASSKRSTRGIRGATGSGRVEVSTAPRKADEAQKATGAEPEPMRERTPWLWLGIKSVRLRLGGQG